MFLTQSHSITNSTHKRPNIDPISSSQVTLGENAPVTREGTGQVPSESLAAESLSSGGEFTSNRNTSASSEIPTNPASTRPHETPADIASKIPEQGQAAPSYVNVPSNITDSSGPHGKNITEDDGLTGRPGKFNVEVGSKEDPSREALRSMQLKQTRGAPGTGEREVGERGKDEQPYAALGGDTFA